MTFGTVTVHTGNPDPSWAVHAFCRVMEKARSLGFVPRTEHVLAEHLFRGEAKVVFYTGGGSGGILALVESEDGLDADDAYEIHMFIAEKQRERRRRKAAQAIEARDERAVTESEPTQ